MFIYTEDFIVIKYFFSPVFSYYLFWNPTKTSIICKDWEQGTVYDLSLGGGGEQENEQRKTDLQMYLQVFKLKKKKDSSHTKYTLW